jgi:hypothetical protein
VRREFRLLAAEAGVGADGSAFSLRMLREILRADPEFRRYMFWMGMYGSGNLMINGQLVVLFTDRLGLSGILQMRIGAAIIGFGMAGANLGWNLGHNDFAPLGRVQHYMGVHVTLTGVRGLIAPPVGMLCHELLERWRPGAGVFALRVPLGMVTSGAFGFVAMREARRSAPAADQQGD